MAKVKVFYASESQKDRQHNQSCQKDNIARRRQPYVKIATISNP